MIDGHPIKDLDIKWLRERIGYVGQVCTMSFANEL